MYFIHRIIVVVIQFTSIRHCLEVVLFISGHKLVSSQFCSERITFRMGKRQHIESFSECTYGNELVSILSKYIYICSLQILILYYTSDKY